MIVLASQSPRRKELLARILKDIPFLTMPSHFNERTIHEKDCAKLVLLEAEGKAKDISSKRKGDVVIASDTMVVFEGKQIGKPKDREDAYQTLKKLQSNEHEVLTGYVIQKDDRILKEGIVTSRLYIAPMSDEEIWRYVDTKSPMDKAGSYGVQDREYIHSEIREGYAENIMGFPVREIEKDLKELKIL